MIPRVTRRLETTLLSFRQALPRPARLYSTPSKRHNAPVTASVQASAPDFPAFLPAEETDLAHFLNRKIPLTILPNPRPASDPSKAADRWFTDSKTLDMTAMIDACLHNLYDVRRATELFNRLRSQVGATALETQLYNAFLEAYLLMSKREEHKKQHWIDEIWLLYEVMESGREEVLPNPKTYSILLAAWHRFRPDSPYKLEEMHNLNPEYIVSKIVERKIPVMDVVCNPFLAEPSLITDVAKALAVAASKLGFRDVLADLGHSVSMPIEDPVLRDIPEVSPVVKETKTSAGSTEYSVPFNLESLRAHLQSFTEARKMLDTDLLARQRHLESSMYELAIEQLKFRAEKFKEQGLDDGHHLHNRSIQAWMWTWHNLLQARLKNEIAAVQVNGAKNPDDAEVILHLTRVSPEKLSLLTILEIMRLSGTGGVVAGMKTARALITVGKAVEGEYKSQVCKEHGLPYQEMRTKSGDFFSNLGYKHLHQRRVAAAQTMSDNEKWTSPLPQAVRSRVGGLLVHCLMEVAQITRVMKNRETGEMISESQPAFFHAYEYMRGQKLGIIKLNPAVSEKLATDSLERTVHPRHLPMLVKPRPWVNYKEGGYLYNKSSAMRFKENHEQEVYLREATNKGKVELIYAGLDVLSSTPWKINRPIFEVVLEVWNAQERMGKIPPAVYDVEEPLFEEGEEHNLQAKSRYIQRHKLWASNKANNHSDRCSVNYKIEIARAFLGDTIYMPHNLDFRGRAYPIPPHLNHIGDDLSRALLTFAEGKPLGTQGLRWLKIHLANLYGYDKAPFADRVTWAEQNMEHIKESATNPLKGSRWWSKADDPWQCLATCMELKNALDLEDPTTYISSLPVHQDGTCNGLQHYAALGGDATGARQVNLAAGDRPSDVYTHISLLVEKDIAIDAAAGDPVAKLLVGKVSRKVVKQTVMTTVYGVTFIGAREQIEKQLRDRGDISEELCWGASSYLAKKVLDTIGDTFKGAKTIQNWLNLCARIISKSIHEDRLGLRPGLNGETLISLPMSQVKKEQMTSVIWTTSMGLPIVQPYRKMARKQVETAIQSVYISDPYKAAEVNTMKQASAFPPNFIHSLDATHMMLTALECKKQGLTFASVHDSYWTHACDVDKMSSTIRDTFIQLHSSGILERLDQEFRERYAKHQVPLDSINTNGSQFVKKLSAAGTRIRLTTAQAAQLRGLAIKDVIEIVDDATAASGMGTQIFESANETEPSENKKTEAFRLLAGKFVKFSDILPPVPTRGTFRVQDIKSSLYFFS